MNTDSLRSQLERRLQALVRMLQRSTEARIGRQRQRAAAALELAIRQPSQPLFEVRAPGFRQQTILRTGTS